MSGFRWLTCRPCDVRQVGPDRFHVRWLDEPATWHEGRLMGVTPRATLLKVAGAWLLLTHVSAPVCYLHERVAREAFLGASGA